MQTSPQIAMASPQNLADIREVLAKLPGADLECATQARTKAAETELDTESAEILSWLARWQGKFPPRLHHPRLILFASDHGLSDGSEKAQMLVEQILAHAAPVCAAAQSIDADLRVYELDLATPTADCAQTAAMGEGECTAAIVYGMMAIEMGLDIVGLAAISNGSKFSAAAIAYILGYEELAQFWAENAPANFLTQTNLLHAPYAAEPLELLRRAGGREIAAIVGAIIAARMAKLPVLLEGAAGLAAAMILWASEPRTIKHCLFTCAQNETALLKTASRLGLTALADEDMAENTGTRMAATIPLLREIL